MTLENMVKTKAKNLGAIFEKEYCSAFRSYEIQLEAPDGMQWIDGQCINMVCVWYPYIKGDKEDALSLLLTRMDLGLELLDKTINP